MAPETWDRARACRRWLDDLARDNRPEDRRAALAAEVVRGIVDVDEPEWFAGCVTYGTPEAPDWERALLHYGSVPMGRRSEAARRLVTAAEYGDRDMQRGALR